MSGVLRLREVAVYPLRIPMRVRFEHASATREVADPVLVRVAAQNPFDDLAGWGETLARPYVTGETQESVGQDVRTALVPALLEMRAESFAEVIEALDQLPLSVGGRCIHAARCAVELAVLDLAGRVFERSPAGVAGWMELRGFGPPGCLGAARYSGVVVGRGARKAAWLLRLQRWAGVRDFKLKVAIPGWEDRLERTAALLGGALRSGRVTLRVDANGGWTTEQALAAAPLLKRCGVSAVEQPLPRERDEDLPRLVSAEMPDLIADESLVSLDDARRLIDQKAVRVFNIRLAKVGGLMPALRMAALARSAGRDVQLGCLVGETSVLTAAGVAFLESCPQVRFVEGAFGRFLLSRDVTRRSLRMGLGARPPRVGSRGLGVDVDEAAVESMCVEGPLRMPL